MYTPTKDLVEEFGRAPRHFESIATAAYLRLIGHSQDETAKVLGHKDSKQVAKWEGSVHWEDARRQAMTWWVTATGDASRVVILRAIKQGNLGLAKWFLERTMPALAPPTKQVFIPWHLLNYDQVKRLSNGEPPERVMQGMMLEQAVPQAIN